MHTEAVCLCTGNTYIMGTKCSHKYSTSKFNLGEYFLGPHDETSL